MARICNVSTGTRPTPSGGAGGVENTVHHLAVALQRLGHDVTVIDVDATSRSPAAYRVVEAKPLWRDFSTLPRHALRGLTFQYAVWGALRQLLETERFDVLHFHGQLGAGINLRAARAHGILTVFSSHNAIWSDPDQCRYRTLRAMHFLEIDALRRAGGVICDSAQMGENFARFFAVPSQKIRVVPIAVDDGVFGSQPVREDLERACRQNGARVILNVARIAPYKDQLTLVRALGILRPEFPQIRLILAGPVSDPRYAARVESEIRTLGLGDVVVRLGEVPRSELLQLYQLCDVFVLPSIREAQGLSAFEAMAKGKPVVASAIPSIRNGVPQDALLTVPPADPDDLARALLRCLRDPPWASAMGGRAREYVTRFYRWSSIAQQTLEAYRAFGLSIA